MKKILLFVVLLVIANTALADNTTYSLSCQKGIVSPGDSKYQVLQKCGQPAFVNTVYSHFRFDGRLYHSSEQWTFNFGPNEFLYYVYFDGNNVSLIISGNDHGN